MKISDYLKITEAANFMGVCTNTLRGWERKKKIHSYRNPVSGFRLYLKTDLQLLLDKIELSGKDKREFRR
jgi:MerR family transcriptional regulator, copper efflux regulator